MKNQNCLVRPFAILVVFVAMTFVGPDSHRCRAGLQREQISLNGEWNVTSDDQAEPKQVLVPSSLEDAWQIEFDGKSVWRKAVPAVKIAGNRRLILHFEAIATEATVWIDGQRVGNHLGGWTSFEFDVTEFAVANADRESWELKVEVDELVGHNTQGFLPIITHHFGGIWQPVWLEIVPATRIETNSVMARGDAETKTVQIGVPILRAPSGQGESVQVSIRPWKRARNTTDPDWKMLGSLAKHELDGMGNRLEFQGEFALPDAILWSPANPQLYEIRFELFANDLNGKQLLMDTANSRFGFANCTNDGTQLLWNGSPLTVRGVLNWGYAPPRIAPSLDEQWMRDEIRFARERGFNLMKFCLWQPPKRYLELCDEMGMLAWIEYPTWHPRLDQKHREELFREYGEFFRTDRNHVSVALRSLTCETGPSADIEVIRELYNLGKTMVPGAMIEDDSSWIEWNRIHDFYDDHPYGNNHTWVSTLNRLNAFIGERKHLPLLLGEAIAADTWTAGNPFSDASPMQRSAHEPWSFTTGRDWLASRQQQADRAGRVFSEQQLFRDSAVYAMAMRKFQIETYRREIPHGGYVVSVIRDFPKAAMGMIDFTGRPKTSPDDWQFQRDQMLLIETPNDCRSFEAGLHTEIRFVIAGFPAKEVVPDSGLTWTLSERNGTGLATGIVGPGEMVVNQESGFVTASVRMPVPGTNHPLAATIRCDWKLGSKHVSNEWPVWICPRPDFSKIDVAATRSFHEELAWEVFRKIGEYLPNARPPKVLVTASMDLQVLKYLESGGSVLMLPGKSDGSFKLEEHWFLRGGPVLFREPDDDGTNVEPHLADEMLVELQHFDLAGPVIPRIDPWIERINPKLLLWDNHDLREFRTHGLLFSMPVGKSGTLMVSALSHVGQSNAAGKWLFGQLLQSLSVSAVPDQANSVAGVANAELLKQNLLKKRISLAESDWNFRADRNDLGHDEKWQIEGTTAADWSTIRIGSHWESQGHPDLDGWAWYRTRIQVPEGWPGQTGFLVFSGVDDYCEVFVNGKLVGSCGDLGKRESAFDLASSIDVGKQIVAGQELELVIAVNDWNGAGGLFRPIFLATEPGDARPEILTPLSASVVKQE